MATLFEELNTTGVLKGLDVNREKWLDKLGLYNLTNGSMSFVDLNETGMEDLNLLMMQSLSYIEFINEKLSVCDKRKRDAELAMDRALNKNIANTSMKLNEAKASAKVSENYIEAHQALNALAAYHDYLIRFTKTIEKYHYAVKNKIQSIQGIKDKYGGDI